MHFGTYAAPNKVTGGQAATNTSGGLAKGQIAVVVRGSLLAYFVTSGEAQAATLEAEDNAPHSRRTNNRYIGRRGTTISGIERF